MFDKTSGALDRISDEKAAAERAEKLIRDQESAYLKKAGAPEISAALATAQANARAVSKGSENTHHGYLYASAEDVIAESKAALASAGLSFTRRGHTLENLVQVGLVLVVRYELRHVSGESLGFSSVIPVVPGKGRPIDKAVLAARTADLSYMLRDLLMLPRVDYDVDGRNDVGYEPEPQQAPPPTPPGPRDLLVLPARQDPRTATTAPPAPTAPPPAAGDNLVQAYLDEIERLYQAGDLLGLKAIPSAVGQLNLTPQETNEIVRYFNPRKIELEEARAGGAS